MNKLFMSSKREWNVSTHANNDESSNHRKYIRTQSTSNNRTVASTSSQQQRQNGDKDKKTTKDTKKPIRVSGDWSEFRSSTGKTYFYNSKTEVSQWEKPKGWPSDNSSNNRTPSSSNSIEKAKKDSTQNNSHSSSTIRSRHKVEEVNLNSRPNSSKDSNVSNRNSSTEPINGHDPSNHHQTDSSMTTRLPSQDDDSSRMSFSSTSSKESSSATNNLQRNQQDQNGTTSTENVLNVQNGTIQKSSNTRVTNEISASTDLESSSSSISKAERDQEIQKYYRAELIQHLTDWPSTQLEKQCLKLFDDYYCYSAKTSTSQTELKTFKSKNRILDIKRAILMQRICRCQQQIRERENDNLA